MTYKAVLSMRRQLIVFAIAMIVYHLIFTLGMAVMAEASSPHVLVQLTLGGPAYFVCALALVCGADLALERSRFGAVSLLFPISRTRHSLTTFAVGIGGLVVAYAFACALDVGAFVAIHGVHALRGGSFFACVVIPFVAFTAFYGLSAFASMVIGHGRFVGPSLAIVCFLALMLTATDVPAHAMFQWCNVVNPVIYLYLATVELLGPRPEPLDLYRSLSLPSMAEILAALAVASLTLTALLFRRSRVMLDRS